MPTNIPDGYYGIDFPEYVYQPYPKWVTKPDGKKVIVQDAAEHQRVITAATQSIATDVVTLLEPKPPISAVVSEPLNERIALIEEAETKGVKIDKRWKNDRIRQAIFAKATE